jgi:cell division protein ZapA
MKEDEQNSTKTYEVVVAGLPLRLKSSHDQETVNQLVRLVDDRMKEAVSVHSNISFQNAIVLAALHMAEDLVFLKRAANQRLDQIESKTKSALSELSGSPLKQLTLDN